MSACGEAVVRLPFVEGLVDLCSFAGEVEAVFSDEDVEAFEERAEEVASGAVGQALVQLTGLLEQVNGCVDAVDAALDAGAGAGELLCHGTLLQGDGLEAFAELAAGELAIGGEVDQPILLRFELVELFAERVFLFLFVGLHLFKGVTYLVADLHQFLSAKLFSSDCPGDSILDGVEPNAGHGAEAALFSGAEVVLVGAAAAGVLAVDEATVASGFLALGTVEQAAKEVEVGAVTVASAVTAVKDLLHGEEQFLGDDRFVASGVEAPFVADDAGVVGVSEDHRELARG